MITDNDRYLQGVQDGWNYNEEYRAEMKSISLEESRYGMVLLGTGMLLGFMLVWLGAEAYWDPNPRFNWILYGGMLSFCGAAIVAGTFLHHRESRASQQRWKEFDLKWEVVTNNVK